MKYSITDNTVEFRLSDSVSEKLGIHLHEQFTLYRESEGDFPSDIIVNISNSLPEHEISAINPSTHIEITNGFIMSHPKYQIAVHGTAGKRTFDLALNIAPNPFVNYLKKFNNIQYDSLEERIGHIVFENILLPAMYFDMDKFLLHCSAFKNQKGEAILIGGSGGVGKTSLEIELCLNKGFTFINDDMAIVGKDGKVYPNLAFPKIYAYNLKLRSGFKKEIFRDRSFADKFAWQFRRFFYGADGVRRKISPALTYGSYAKEPAQLKKYFILVRKNTEQISSVTIDARTAFALSLKILQTEMAFFDHHLLWHEYNCLACGEQPLITLDAVHRMWEKHAQAVFQNIECHLIFIPQKIDHTEFVREVSALVGS